MKKHTKQAPIAFFAYIRPEHTKLSLESLARNFGAEDSELYIFCDGPKSTREISKVTEVREIVKSYSWCGSVHIVEHEKNRGLASSVISGVSELCERYGRVIVLEDDLVLSPYFLRYMNSGLDIYEDSEKVMQISGFMFPVEEACNDDTFFLPITTSWGWATWQKAWKNLDTKLCRFSELSSDSKSINRFDINGTYPYFSMLSKQVNGEIDSWAIQWYFSVFMNHGLILYPKWSLVENIGNDGSGTHSTTKILYKNRVFKGSIQTGEHKIIKICRWSLENIQKFLSLNKKAQSLPHKKIFARMKMIFSKKLVGR